MTTEELIKAARELMELDNKAISDKAVYQDLENHIGHMTMYSAKIARALVVAVDALEKYTGQASSHQKGPTFYSEATEALAEIQKIAEE